jgi:prepilin-type N-terminal cleavage/methylation domain-containing protein
MNTLFLSATEGAATAPAAPSGAGERSFAPTPSRRHRRGFSLIEVTLALLVVGVGLVALLGLFPVGLRESGLATADTTQSIFANGILNAIHANAGEITDPASWMDPSLTAFTAGIRIPNITAGGVQTIIDAYGISNNIIRYQLEIGFVAGYSNIIRYAAIRVSENRYSDISRNPVYYTEFRYEVE